MTTPRPTVTCRICGGACWHSHVSHADATFTCSKCESARFTAIVEGGTTSLLRGDVPVAMPARIQRRGGLVHYGTPEQPWAMCSAQVARDSTLRAVTCPKCLSRFRAQARVLERAMAEAATP